MKYYLATIDEGSEMVVIYARNKSVAYDMVNEDCEFDLLKRISAEEAKKLICRGFRLIDRQQ